MEIMRYRVNDAKRKRKLRQLAHVKAPEDLRGELAAARLLLQESLEQGSNTAGLSNLLLNTIGKLAHGQTTLKKLNEEYLDRDAARRLVESLCNVVSRAIRNKFPGWENTIDEIADALTTKVEEPMKTEQQ